MTKRRASAKKRLRASEKSPPNDATSARRDRFTVIDLFSGPGGTGLGFRRAGFEVVAAVEIDESAADTYERNIGVEVERRDITRLNPKTFRRRLGLRTSALDVLVGCPPCQGFTRLRNRTGAGDPRNSLVLRYLSFVAEFKPKYAVFENVPGLVKTRHGRHFYRRLTEGLSALGYRFTRHELNAADFGVAQRRLRVIVVASRESALPMQIPRSHDEPGSPEVAAGKKAPWQTVRAAIGNGRLPLVRVGQKPDPVDPNHVAADTGDDVIAFLRRVPKNGGSRRDVWKRYWLDCHKEHDGHYDTYGRLSWDAPSNTITSGCTNPSKGRFVHPTQARALTIREAALLQGFPRGYRFLGSFQAEQVGNAVPPPLACAVARAIARELRARQNGISAGS